MESITTQCCIVGGGPAGIFLGYLLARSGVSVVVLEKHADFLRDFRGDTIHPSTLELLHELGILDEFLPIVDFRADLFRVNFNGQSIVGPRFDHLTTQCKFVGFVPQWDLLNLLSETAKQYPEFDLRMSTRACELIREADRVVGVRAKSDDGDLEIRADLVVAADGRGSTIREACGYDVIDTGVPIDALWFRLDRPAGKDDHTLAWFKDGHMLVTIPRRSHYQVAMIIRKGGFDEIQSEGIETLRQTIRETSPLLADVAESLDGWDDVKLLTVQINHIEKWYEDGLLLIGDAAHAMSPMGGVGINLAVQDAVAAANHLVEPLRSGALTTSYLQAIQKRRAPAARRTQRLQATMHAMIFGRGGSANQAITIPWYARWFGYVFAPILRRIAGRLIGMGFQPEHIETKPVERTA